MKSQHEIIKDGLLKVIPITVIAKKLGTYTKKIHRIINSDKELQVARQRHLTNIQNWFES